MNAELKDKLLAIPRWWRPIAEGDKKKESILTEVGIVKWLSGDRWGTGKGWFLHDGERLVICADNRLSQRNPQFTIDPPSRPKQKETP